MKKLQLPALLGAALFATSSSQAAPVANQSEVVYPADSNVLDVTKAPYNAVPNDGKDDTEAINKALFDTVGGEGKPRIVYLPNGVYNVSGMLRWAGRQTRTILEGQSESGAVIKLRDNAPGFDNPNDPTSVIWTGQHPAQRFRNGIRNLTVDTGKGNPGAIGIRYMANNQGAMRYVTIRSGDGKGPIGLDLGYSNEQGPCLIKNITVRGFDVGISTKFGVNSVTLDNILLENQNEYGFVNDGQCISMENFTSRNSVPAYWNKRGSGLTAVINSKLEGIGAASNVPAMVNDAGMFARRVETSGYKMAIQNSAGTKRDVTSANTDEFSSHPVLSLFPSPPKSLNLEIKETPKLPNDPLDQWANAAAKGPVERDWAVVDVKKQPVIDPKTGQQRVVKVKDWAPSIQAAIDSGKTTIYFPTGDYPCYGPVVVRGNARRFVGLESAFGKGAPCEITIEPGAAPVVSFENFDWNYSRVFLTNKSKSTVVISSVIGGRYTFEKGSGDVFVEDVCSSVWNLNNARTWMRQVNPEAGSPTTDEFDDNQPRGIHIPGWDGMLIDGAQLWILGLKTEGDGIPVTLINGAKCEIIGGFIYANRNYRPEKQWVTNDESSLSLTLGENVIRNQPFDPVWEKRGDEVRVLKKGQAPGRGGGSMVTLYTGYKGNATAPPAAPTNVAAKTLSTSKILVSWTDTSKDEDGFTVQTSSDGKTWNDVATAPPGATSIEVLGLRADTAFDVRVRAFNGAGATGESQSKARTAPPQAPGNGTGLRASIFPKGDFSGTPVVSEMGNVNWSSVPNAVDAAPAPAPILAAQKGSAGLRLRGFIEPRFSDTYTLYITANSDMRVLLDGALVLDSTRDGERRVLVEMEAGKRVSLLAEMPYFSVNPLFKLEWSSANQPREVIPQSQLFPPTKDVPVVTFAVNNTTISEAGPPATVTVSRSDASGPLTVNFGFDGSAAPGGGFKPVPTKIEFAPGQKTAQFSIAPLNNSRPDPPREILVVPTPSGDYDLAGGRLKIALSDDDTPAKGAGTGLRGEYWWGRDITAPSRLIRLDRTLNFEFGTPAPRFPAEFTARWTGQIQPLFSEEYTFNLNADDISRLTINGQVLVDIPNPKFNEGKVDPRTAKIKLEAGKKYDIEVLYTNARGGGNAKLSWQSASQFREIVPSSQLFPTGEIPAPVRQAEIKYGNGTGLKAEYFVDRSLTPPAKLTRVEGPVNFNGRPTRELGELWGARWTGEILPIFSEEYTFTLDFDDEGKMWIGDQLIIEFPKKGAPTKKAGKITLEAGKRYPIRLEYGNSRGTGSGKLVWESASQWAQVVPKSQLFPAK